MALRTTQLEFIVVIWPSHYQQQDLRLFSELNSHQIAFAHTTYTCVFKPGCRESLLASPQSLGPSWPAPDGLQAERITTLYM